MSARVMTETNLFDYFQARVEDARSSPTVRLSDETSLYLATLLTDRARTDRPAPPEDTLAELHLRAANAPPAQQARAYRELGDRALYLLGYFSESLERRAVGPTYYAEMGSAAYYRVDAVFKKWFADAFGPVFHELALRFEICVRVLAQVRAAHRDDRPDDPLWLYERWLATGQDQYAAKLRERGLLILPKGGTDA